MGRDALAAVPRKEHRMEEQEQQSSQEWESGKEPEADEGAETGKQDEAGESADTGGS